MEINVGERRKEGRPLGKTDPGVESTADLVGGGGEVTAELDPIDIEILLTSGHVDDCCIS